MPDERDIRPGGTLTGQGLRDIIAGARPDVRGGNGINVKQTAQGRDVIVSQATRQDSRPIEWVGKVNSAASADGSNRWTYPVVELVKSTTGYDGFAVKTNGRSVTARNMVEDQNAASGVQGNGVDVADLVGTFALQPIPVDTLVLVREIVMADGESREYWIVGMPNGITGDCPTPQALTAADIEVDPYDDISDTILQDFLESTLDKRLRMPASQTTNAVPRLSGGSSNQSKNSGLTIDDAGNCTAGLYNGRNVGQDGSTLDGIAASHVSSVFDGETGDVEIRNLTGQTSPDSTDEVVIDTGATALRCSLANLAKGMVLGGISDVPAHPGVATKVLETSGASTYAWIDTPSAGGGAVDSVFGRTGAVVAVAADYDAIKIAYDNATSGLTATTVQAAVDELENEIDGKAATAHTHVAADVTDITLIDTADSRLSDARAPTADAATHTNGTDDIQSATASVKGLATAAQIAKLDAIEAGAEVNPSTLAELNTDIADATLIDTGDSRLSDARVPMAHASDHTDGTDDIQSATASVKGLATAAQITKLDAIEALADVTDATNVAAAGAVMDSDTTISVDTVSESTPAAGVTIDGMLIKDGLVDGRDPSVDGTKLDGIEALADVTDATNVDAAGATMNSDLIATSTGSSDSGLPVKTNAEGVLNLSVLTPSVTFVMSNNSTNSGSYIWYKAGLVFGHGYDGKASYLPPGVWNLFWCRYKTDVDAYSGAQLDAIAWHSAGTTLWSLDMGVTGTGNSQMFDIEPSIGTYELTGPMNIATGRRIVSGTATTDGHVCQMTWIRTELP